MLVLLCKQLHVQRVNQFALNFVRHHIVLRRCSDLVRSTIIQLDAVVGAEEEVVAEDDMAEVAVVVPADDTEVVVEDSSVVPVDNAEVVVEDSLVDNWVDSLVVEDSSEDNLGAEEDSIHCRRNPKLHD